MFKDRDALYTIIVGVIIMIVLIAFLIFFILTYQKRYLKHQLELNKVKESYEKEFLRTQLEIQEQTLKNISQEIHDNIGQVLTLAKLNVNTMNCDDPVALQGKINDSKILISKAIQDLRDLSRSMNTDYIMEAGLLRSVEYELELIKRTGIVEVVFKADGKHYRLEEQKELILFRIVQEILNNIIKHAKATLIDVHVRFEPELFTLTITDNGIGFDASKLETGDYTGFGLGILNMYNRARMIDTDFSLNSTIGKGVDVVLSLPVKRSS